MGFLVRINLLSEKKCVITEVSCSSVENSRRRNIYIKFGLLNQCRLKDDALNDFVIFKESFSHEYSVNKNQAIMLNLSCIRLLVI